MEANILPFGHPRHWKRALPVGSGNEFVEKALKSEPGMYLPTSLRGLRIRNCISSFVRRPQGSIDFLGRLGVISCDELKLDDSSSSIQPAMIDLRSRIEFGDTGHLRGAYCIPIDEFGSHGFETPPRHVHITFFYSTARACTARQFVASHSRLFPSCSLAEVSAGFLQYAASNGMLEFGPNPPGRFLFPMNPLLSQEIDGVEKSVLGSLRQKDGLEKDLRKVDNGLLALDLGCGSGRDVIRLADRGWNVVGLDSMAKALDRCRNLAERQGIDSRVHLVHATLSGEGSLVSALTPLLKSVAGKSGMETAKFDLIVISRFHDEKLLSDIANLLAPGGFILYHTFMMECSRPTSPDKKLERGYLSKLAISEVGPWKDISLTVLRDEVGQVPGANRSGGDPRKLSFFVAQASL